MYINIYIILYYIYIYIYADCNNLTDSCWSIGSTRIVKENRAQTREMGDMLGRY